MNKFSYGWSPAGFVEKLLADWEPGNLKNEKGYEKSLYDLLVTKLPDQQIVKQYAQARVRADVVVDEKIIIELKHNLKTTGVYQRLLGQIEAYTQWRQKWGDDETVIFIVITGEIDENLLHELKKHVGGGLFKEERAKIILK